MKGNTKKIVALSIIGLVGLGLGAGMGFVLDKPKTIEVIKEVPIITEKVVVVDKEVPVEVEKLVSVEVPFEDTAFLSLACNRMLYDDLQACKQEVLAEDAALKLAFKFVEQELADELEDADLVSDESDVKLIKLYKDFKDVEVLSSDFEDGEYEFKIFAKVADKEEDTKFKVAFTVEIEDGEAKITGVELVD